MTILFETKSRQDFNNVPCVLDRLGDGDCGQASARVRHRRYGRRGDDEKEEETGEHGGLESLDEFKICPNSTTK